MRPFRAGACVLVAASGLVSEAAQVPVPPSPAPLGREQWGAPAVTVAQERGSWQIAGRKQRVTLRRTDLALTVQAGATTWSMVPSSPEDMTIRAGGRDFHVRLAAARRIEIVLYDTGFKTGLKLTLSGWDEPGAARPMDLTLFLTIALEGRDEELVFQVAAEEKGAVIRRLDWPPALDGHEVDFTVLNHYRGLLLPRDWPEAYDPIRGDRNFPNDTSEIQSHVVECWSASWWGFQKGPAAMMVIVETPDDAAYRFRHPAGGPTVIGPRWRAQLGRLGYPRAARMVFFEKGNYVDLAKR